MREGSVRLLLMTGAALFALAAPAGAETPAGMIKTAAGAAFVVHAGQREPAKVGRELVRDDVLETGRDGAIGVTFRDNATVSIGPDTQLALDDFVFAPERQQYSFVTRMTRGTMAFVSGTISKLAPEAVAVKTPVGTIGVRGTRFLVKLDGD
jgi:hypothetical protein